MAGRDPPLVVGTGTAWPGFPSEATLFGCITGYSFEIGWAVNPSVSIHVVPV